MNIKRPTRAALTAALAAGAVAGAFAAPASASPMTEAANGCIVEVTLVKAWNLQEPPQDETYLRLNTQYTSTRTFREFQQRLGSEFGDVTEFVALGSSLRIAAAEADFPSKDDPLGSFTVACTGVASSGSEHVTGANADYEISYAVSVVP